MTAGSMGAGMAGHGMGARRLDPDEMKLAPGQKADVRRVVRFAT